MHKESKIYISGHSGFLGSKIKLLLEERGYNNIVVAEHGDLDLENQNAVENFFRKETPEYVFHTAAMAGMEVSLRPANVGISNMYMACNVIKSAFDNNVKKLLYTGSSWIYPGDCPQPIKEDEVMSGPLETAGEAYSFAKLTGIKLCQYYKMQYNADFISGILCNIYGPNDHFDGRHVVSGLIQRFYTARQNNLPTVEVWGSGNPRRDFMYIDDTAEACILLMSADTKYPLVNISPGIDYSIKELSNMIARLTEFNGEILFDTSKHDGIPRRLLDNTRLKLLGGCKSLTALETGLEKTLEWYRGMEDKC
jgi:GDP-L-fucose synthase